MRLRLFYIFFVIPFITKAQTLPEIRIGIDGHRHSLLQDTLTEKIKLDFFKQDSKIIIEAGENTYDIKSYSLWILPVRGDIWGPVEVNDNNANDILNNKTIQRLSPTIKERLLKGDKIAIQNISAICSNCKPAQKKTFSLLLTIIIE